MTGFWSSVLEASRSGIRANMESLAVKAITEMGSALPSSANRFYRTSSCWRWFFQFSPTRSCWEVRSRQGCGGFPILYMLFAEPVTRRMYCSWACCPSARSYSRWSDPFLYFMVTLTVLLALRNPRRIVQ